MLSGDGFQSTGVEGDDTGLKPSSGRLLRSRILEMAAELLD
jgi:hypothetical protein